MSTGLTAPSNAKLTAARALVPLGALLALLPVVPAGAALVAGALLGLTLGNPYAAKTRKLAQGLLQLAVIGIGFGMDLRQVAQVGMHGVGWTVAGIAGCLLLGTLLARGLHVPGKTGLLISVGTAICGGSAIAAVAPVLRADEDEIAVSLATVFLLNAIALLIFPPIGRAFHLDQDQFGLWAALAIHDTSSVVGAARAYGAHALEVATVVKLARALWIVPITLVIGVWSSRKETQESRAQQGSARSEEQRPALSAALGAPSAQPPIAPRTKAAPPWFIAGFLAAAALVTFFPALQPAGQVIRQLAQQLLVATLFLIGAGLSTKSLRQVGTRPLLQGVLLWLCAGALSLLAIKL